ncbi:MAG TPA: glycosyltransferase family 2 protein [Polyangiaceae bacterium]|nr:glycosyltransferase family 2 protein [Polyangiaceae bacterium]
MNSPSIAAIIVNWNSRDDVVDAVRSLLTQADSDVDIVVVDNGSKDGSVEALQQFAPQVRVIETGANLGFAEGCNRGIEASNSDWVFILNNDAIVAPGGMARLRAAAAAAPEDLGMLQPCIVFRTNPDQVNSSGVIVFSNGAARDRDFAAPVSATQQGSEVFCCTAGAALYRRSMLQRVKRPTGYFDRTFFMYFEDVDLGWRCRLAGYRAVYFPEVVVLHRFQASSSRRGRHFARSHSQANRVRSLIKNASPRMLARSIPRTVSDLTQLTMHDPRALGRLLRTLPELLQERQAIASLRQVDPARIEKDWMANKHFPAPKPDLPAPPKASSG